jgi:hypothetical protein
LFATGLAALALLAFRKSAVPGTCGDQPTRRRSVG